MFWLNTSTFHIKHGADYALLLSRIKGKGNFIYLPKRYWANSFGPGSTLKAKQVLLPRTVALHESLANMWILLNTKNLFHKAVRHIHSKQLSRTVYWKRSAQIQAVAVFSRSNIFLFYSLPLNIFSLFSIYIFLIWRRDAEIHSRFQVFQCETEVISHFQEFTLSMTMPTPFLISGVLSYNPRLQIFHFWHLLVTGCHSSFWSSNCKNLKICKTLNTILGFIFTSYLALSCILINITQI